jgi:hypothetical protein
MKHHSRLDKATPESQSSTDRLYVRDLFQNMKPPFRALSLSAAVCLLLVALLLFTKSMPAQAPPPPDAPDVVDYSKLLPLLPEPPSEWTADKADGSTTDVGGFNLTTVHRDYKKGETDDAPTASISILDSVLNPDSIAVTLDGWKVTSETAEGYVKPVTIDGDPGSESFEKDQKHAALRLLVAHRYFVTLELQNQDPKELQVWVKRLDLKKLAEIK